MKQRLLLGTSILLGAMGFGASEALACDRYSPQGWLCKKNRAKVRVSYRKHKSSWVKKARYKKKLRSHRLRAKYARARKVRHAAKANLKQVRVASNHSLVRISGAYRGGNPTGQRYLWCQDFINLVLRKSGRKGTGSRRALSSMRLGTGVSRPAPGDIAVRGRGRRGGGHVGIVVAVKGSRVLIRGGNQCGRRGKRVVCDSWQSRARYRYRRV